jgi:micrococcal nuclease
VYHPDHRGRAEDASIYVLVDRSTTVRCTTLAIVALCVATVVAPVTATSTTPTAGETVTVTDVIDGDTIDVRYDNGTTDTVRMIGVDAPEVVGETNPDAFAGVPDTREGREWLRSYGETASDYATDRLEGERVTIEPDGNEPDRDPFGRLLRYVSVDGDRFDRALLERGLARVFESDFTMRDEFESVEHSARNADRGLWGFEPAGGRTTHGITVTTVHADAEGPGDERDNLDDEFIVFENVRTEPLDLSAWRVADAADHVYEFPSNYTLDPGERVTLHTGEGTNTRSDRYWKQGAPIWNNGGDTIVASNPYGGEALNTTYDGDGHRSACRSPASFDGPLDVDCDGLYEDVNGDVDRDAVDVQRLFATLDGPVVAGTPAAFDFNRDGTADIVDVQRLFTIVT